MCSLLHYMWYSNTIGEQRVLGVTSQLELPYEQRSLLERAAVMRVMRGEYAWKASKRTSALVIPAGWFPLILEGLLVDHWHGHRQRHSHPHPADIPGTCSRTVGKMFYFLHPAGPDRNEKLKYMCIYMYVDEYTCICICIYIYLYMHMYICIYIYRCI